MFLCRIGWLRLACVIVSSWTLWGCQAPPSFEDLRFEDPDEKIARIEREQMLHRRTILEVSGRGFFAFNSNFETGYGIGVEGQLEAYKNLYLGLRFDYIQQDVDETVEDVLKDFQAGDPQAEIVARGLDPEQWMESFDRYNILFTFDYDVPLWEGDRFVPIFRFGLGLGAVIIQGDEVSDGTFADNVDSRIFSQFLAQPSLGFRFPLLKNLLLFADATLDLIPEDRITVDGALFQGNRTKIKGDVGFSGVNVGGGIALTW